MSLEANRNSVFQRLYDFFTCQDNLEGFFCLLAFLKQIPNGQHLLANQISLSEEAILDGHTLTSGMIYLGPDETTPGSHLYLSSRGTYRITSGEHGQGMTLINGEEEGNTD